MRERFVLYPIEAVKGIHLAYPAEEPFGVFDGPFRMDTFSSSDYQLRLSILKVASSENLLIIQESE